MLARAPQGSILDVCGGMPGCCGTSNLADRSTVFCAEKIFSTQVQGLAVVRQEPRTPSLFRALSTVVKQEGFLSLWKGNGVTIVHRLPYSAVNFWTYEQVQVMACLLYMLIQVACPCTMASLPCSARNRASVHSSWAPECLSPV